ncbi:MAG: head-tail adaptor protein [Hyphomonas sp.]
MARHVYDHRLQVLRADRIFDGLQHRGGPHLPVGPALWASLEPISDGERFRADSIARQMTVRFRVRRSAQTAAITMADRLRCRDITYAVGGIKPLGRAGGFEITARLLPGAGS